MLRRMVLLCMMLCSGVGWGFAQQDEPSTPSPLYGVITVFTETGSFIPDEEEAGIFTLTFNRVPSAAPYWTTQAQFMTLPPELIGPTPVDDTSQVGSLLLASMTNAWLMDSDLSADAWLSLRNTSVHLRLTQPDFFPGENTLSFTAEILGIIGGEEEKGEMVAPEEFRTAFLSIILTEELIVGLDLGIANAIGSVRWNCSGTDRQIAICECKREADRLLTEREDRVTAYLECNATLPEEENKR